MRSRYTLPIALVLVLLAAIPARAGADTIHFKNRSVLNNVKVLAEDWRGVQVQISDMVRMSFTRKDIDRIERGRMATERPTLRPEPAGVRVPSALRAKLTQSIAVNYPEPTSFVEILANISELYSINITVDPKVREKIVDGSVDPLWTFTKADGSNVLQMLAKLEEDKALTYQISDSTILIGVPGPPAAPVSSVQPTVPALRIPTPPVMPTPTVRPAAPATTGPATRPAGRQRPGGRAARGGPGRGPMGRRGARP